MKPSCPQHVKFLRLKRRLGLSHWQAVGLLESIWLCTQISAPAGDIGKLSNEDIAAMIEWDSDADELIVHLVHCGFLDESEDFRLVVHDWHEHAPTWTKGVIAKAESGFASNGTKLATKCGTKLATKCDTKSECSTDEEPTKCDSSLGDQATTYPNETYRNESCPEDSVPAQDQQTVPKRTGFSAPSPSEVADYCRERGNNVDPEHFVDYYTTRGWVLSNGKKMADWRAAVRTWEKNSHQRMNGKSLAKHVEGSGDSDYIPF